MGTKWSSVPAKLDLVSELPPKLVCVILSFLSLSDVRNCLLVSKRWKESILHLEPYWLSALQTLGLSQTTISLYAKHFSNLKELYLTAKRHLSGARSMELVSSMAVCYPHYPAADCFVVRGRNILVRRGSNGKDTWLRVEELASTGSVVSTQCVSRVQLSEGNSTLTWAHFAMNGYLWWSNGKGLVELCSVSGSRGLESSVNLPQALAVCREEETFKHPGRVEFLSFGQSLEGGNVEAENWSRAGKNSDCNIKKKQMLGGCNKCPMLVACEIISKSTLSCLQIIVTQPNKEQEERNTTLRHDTSSAVRPDARLEESASILLVSTSEGKDEVCHSHYALIQQTHSIILFLTKENLTSVNELKMAHQCITCSYRLPGKVCSNIKPFCSGALLAQVCERELCVWKVNHHRPSKLTLVSRTEIIPPPGRDNRAVTYELIAVGESLSIIRTKGKIDDSISIVHTDSGQTLNQLPHWTPRSKEFSLLTSKCSFLLSQEAEQWLSSFTSPCPRTLLTVVCGTSTGRLAFILVQKQHIERQCHWVQGNNYLFKD